MTGQGEEVRVVPANQATWDDLATIFEAVKRHGSPCYCQRLKIRDRDWNAIGAEERAHQLRVQTGCGERDEGSTSGLVAYVGNEPVGWCAIEPRFEYPQLRTNRIVWAQRDENKDDRDAWALTCIIIRRGYRRTGLTYPMVIAAVTHAKASGARAIEAYPMVTTPDTEIMWGELHVGPLGPFIAAGFRELTQPSTRRRVVRIDLEPTEHQS